MMYRREIQQGIWLVLLAWSMSALAGVSAEPGRMPAVSEGRVFDVCQYGARGDGKTLDRAAINRAIEACASAGGGQVRFPPGRYLSGTIRLRSHITLLLEAGAVLVGTSDLTQYQAPILPTFMPEARWGRWHCGLILGEDVEDVAITGPGTIDGNKVFDPNGEERMRGPHTLVFVNGRRLTIRDVSIVDSANYAILFQVSDQVEIRNVRIVGGWDGVHFRGAPGHDCHDVTILGCQFYTGDDSIAGRYWDNVVISDCLINSSCNGLRVIGPATRLIVHDCLFYGPGLQPHRSSREQRRTNMLSGIILQPGAWDATRGPLDDVLISDVTMHRVASPVALCIKEGNTVGRVTVEDLHATGVYRSAISVESWAGAPVGSVVLRRIIAEFDGGGTAEQAKKAVQSPGVDVRPLPAWGIYARHVDRITLEDVRLSLNNEDLRPVLMAEDVKQLELDHLRFPRVKGVAEPVITKDIVNLVIRDQDQGLRGPP